MVESPTERALIMESARATALGQTDAGRIAGVNEAEYLNAAFASLSSGFSAAQTVERVESSALLALAGQTTPKQAQIGLDQFSKFFPEMGVRQSADMIAKAQDMFSFPTGITGLTEGFRGAGAIAQKFRISPEDMLLQQGVFADVGRRGATGGTATRILWESVAKGFDKLGMELLRHRDGTLDVVGNLRRVQNLGLSEVQMSDTFTRRGSTAITQQIAGIGKLDAGLGEYGGTAIANASEHMRTFETTLKRYTARQQTLNANVGEGAIAARTLGLNLKTGLITAANAMGPGFAKVLGVGGEVGKTLGGAAVGVLDLSVGLHALNQLTGERFKIGALARRTKATFNAVRLGIFGVRYGFAGMFSFLGKALPVGAGRDRGSDGAVRRNCCRRSRRRSRRKSGWRGSGRRCRRGRRLRLRRSSYCRRCSRAAPRPRSRCGDRHTGGWGYRTWHLRRRRGACACHESWPGGRRPGADPRQPPGSTARGQEPIRRGRFHRHDNGSRCRCRCR